MVCHAIIIKLLKVNNIMNKAILTGLLKRYRPALTAKMFSYLPNAFLCYNTHITCNI